MAANDSTTAPPTLKMYTNHGCGWCHRVHITLKELQLPYEEVRVDLDGPRPDWFLKLNPRGLVPVLQYTPAGADKPLTLTESALIVQFLTTLHPSHFTTPTLAGAEAPLAGLELVHHAYNTAFLVDTFFDKVNTLLPKIASSEDQKLRAKLVDDIVGVVEREIEPVLERDGIEPWFGGSAQIGLAEALITPFSLRFYAFANDRILPSDIAKRWDQIPLWSKWMHRCFENPSVLETWEPEVLIPAVEARMGEIRKKFAGK